MLTIYFSSSFLQFSIGPGGCMYWHKGPPVRAVSSHTETTWGRRRIHWRHRIAPPPSLGNPPGMCTTWGAFKQKPPETGEWGWRIHLRQNNSPPLLLSRELQYHFAHEYDKFGESEGEPPLSYDAVGNTPSIISCFFILNAR